MSDHTTAEQATDRTDRTGPHSAYRPDGIQDAFVDGADGSRGASPRLPSIGVTGWLRWIWRQVTSMRVALLLLMLLAVAAVPGSALPQRPQDPAAVAQYLEDNPTFGPWFDRLGFLDVYASVWFSAIYILLFVSLIGCILPRVKAHFNALGARPPRVPIRFTRFPAQGQREYFDLTPQDVVEAAHTHLTGPLAWLPTFRVDKRTEEVTDRDWERGVVGDQMHTVSAERGYLRESGNLLFHLSLVGLLIAVGIGQALEYRGQAIIVEGRGFVNSVSGYDSFESGALFRDESLSPFSVMLDEFVPVFTLDEFPRAQDFTAHVRLRVPGGEERAQAIKVNHPLLIEGAKIYLQGNGYAPSVSLTDADGNLAFAGSVPFPPEDPVYTSRGVIKVPDVTSGDQIGMIGYLLPTGQIMEEGVRSIHPMPYDPIMIMTVWRGNLGLDEGIPQNVYELDTEDMTQVFEPGSDSTPVTLVLRPGDSVELPEGLGTFTFDELPRFVALDLRHNPALVWVLIFALSAPLGLAVSLFTPRRRVWVRAWTEQQDGQLRTVVEAAGLARSDDTGLQGEVDSMLSAIDVKQRTPDRNA